VKNIGALPTMYHVGSRLAAAIGPTGIAEWPKAGPESIDAK
jgi:hypothetical protein